jgi:hypothetical protein
MFACRTWVIGLVLALSACGKSHAPTPVPAASVTPGASPSASGAPDFGRGPSKTILSSWTPPVSPVALLYADLGALFKTELLQNLVTSVTSLVQESLAKDAATCLLDWTLAVRELAAAASDKQVLVVLGYDPNLLKVPVGTCLKTLGFGRTVDIANSTPAYAIDEWVLVVLRRTVVLGSQPLVEASLSMNTSGDWPQQLTLGKDQQLVFTGTDKSRQLDIKGRITITKSHFSLSSDMRFPDVQSATAAANKLEATQIQQQFSQANPQAEEMIDGIIKNWHVRQVAQNVGVEFSADGTAQEMGQRIGAASAVAIDGVRKVIANAKAAIARTTIRAIADRLVAAKPKKLSSLPPIPGKFEMVQGKKYPSVPSDWKGWKSIGFSLSEPQYYQYRVDAAKDGTSAEIIAQGDLDADGQMSRYSLAVEFDPKTHQLSVGSDIDGQDPLE